MHSTKALWQRPDIAACPPLAADLQVDVAVVGGGITGLTTALLLSEAGKRVAVLEGGRIGAGVTGRTTAHLTEVVDTRYHELESSLGPETAQLVRSASREAIETIASLASKIECEFQRVNGYLFTEREDQMAELDAELLAAQRAGAAVSRSQVPLALDTRAALCFENQAQFQPLAYLAGLAERLHHGGALLFEDTQVLEVDTSHGPPRLQTGPGPTVVADRVVMATHAYFGKMSLELKLAQYRSYVVAGQVAKAPAGLFWDMEDPYHYVRRAFIDGQCYAIVGGEDHRTGVVPDGGGDAPYRHLEAYAARLGIPAELRWSAQVVEPADGLPYIGALESDGRVQVATGFAGNGMTFGTLSARIIADALLGRSNPYSEVFRPNRTNVLASAGAVLGENAETASHLLKGHLLPVSDEPLDKLPVGAGRIVKEGDHKLAVYRDQAGALHRVSAICTHQGCQVAFNPVERSWDCPCHGSRFDIDGRVLHGPALTPLEPKP